MRNPDVFARGLRRAAAEAAVVFGLCLGNLGGLQAQEPSILAVDEGVPRLSIFRVSDFQLIGTVELGSGPGFPAEVPALKRLYVPNRDSNSVTVIDLEGGGVVTTITHPSFAQPVAAASGLNGTEVWIVNRQGGSGSGSLTLINPTTNTVSLVVNNDSLSTPVHVAVHPTSGLVFVVNGGNNTVTVLSPSPLRSTRAIVPVGSNPTFAIVVPQDNFAFVAGNGSGTVTRINAASFTTQVLFVGGHPRALAASAGRIFVSLESNAVAQVQYLPGIVEQIPLPMGVSSYGLGLVNGSELLAIGDQNLDRIHILNTSTRTEVDHPALPLTGFTSLGSIATSGQVSVSDLSIEQTESDDPVRASVNFSYFLRVRNDGPSNATHVVIQDLIPPEAALESAQVPGGECLATAAGVDCKLNSLAVGSEVVATVVLRYQQTGTFLNIARVTADEDDPNPDNNEDNEETTALPAADLEALMEVTPGTAPVGAAINFDIRIRNLGPTSANGVSVLLDTPPALELIDFDVLPANCQFGVSSARCNLAGILSQGIFELHFSYAALSPGSFQSSVVTTTSDFDPDDSNNSKLVPIVITAADFFTDIAVTKRVLNPVARIGETAVFSLEVTNLGPDNEPAVRLTDQIPAGLSFVSFTPPSPDCRLEASSYDCRIGEIAVGQSRTYTIRLRVDPGANGLIENRASGRGLGQDLDPSNNSASDVLLVLDSGDFNADGQVDAADLQELILEIQDGDGELVGEAGGGSHPGIPQMDLDNNGLINRADIDVMVSLLFKR